MPPPSSVSALWLTALVAGPVAGAVILACAARGRRTAAGIALAATAATAAALCIGCLGTPADHVVTADLPWVPSLGLDLTLAGDRLSLFFAAAALGVGVLVIVYATGYFGGSPPAPRRFYGVLLAFMAAMIGAVLADHVIVLYLFWELTSVASFLLIGTHHEDANARVAARQALLVTAATGFCLLTGLILLGHIADTNRLSTMLADTGWVSDPRTPVAIVLILVGALGKAAQVPFHFWLTGAMTAPTPVSAYLHSATMVKLGVYVCARLDPAFAGWPSWHVLLLVCGWSSMLIAGGLALFAQDIKGALAYATISSLGYLLGLYGVGATEITTLDLFHTGNHVLYKAGLFLVAGIVVHLAGTRNLRELGGFARTNPALAALCALFLAAMIGLPGTTGFISKEAILRPLLADPGHGLLLSVFGAGIVLKVMFALRFFHAIFLGSASLPRTALSHPWSLQAPAWTLAGVIVGLGLFPQATGTVFESWPVLGRDAEAAPELAAWHGFTREFAVTLALLAGGALLHTVGAVRAWFQHAIPRVLDGEALHAWGLRRLDAAARTMARAWLVDRPLAYLPCLFLALAAAGLSCAVMLDFDLGARLRDVSFTLPPWRWLIAALIAAAALGVPFARLWTTQLLALSIAGFLLCIYFALFRAPDLALTQILVETLLLLLFVFLLARFPKSAERGEQPPSARRWTHRLNPLLAVGCGAGTTVGLLVLTRPLATDAVGWELLQLSKPGAQAANAVNAIVVDFRGLDTLGESMVLIIALLGSLGLLMRFRRGAGDHDSPAADPEKRSRLHHKTGKTGVVRSGST